MGYGKGRMTTIFTLNSRGNVFLEAIRDHFKIPAVRMRREIVEMHRAVVQVLSKKGIEYAHLRNGLVPQMDKHEAAFIFDSTEVASGLYGPEAIQRLLPLLESNSTQSLLVGDLIAEDRHQRLVAEILQESMVWARGFTFRHSVLLYAVYVNGLSEASIARLHRGLADWPAYLGFVPTTFMSRAKLLLSTTLTSFVLKHRRTLIMGHEDDRDNAENINITLYPLESSGHRIVSLQGLYFSLFLAYKIERPMMSGFEADTELALNAVSDEVALFGDFQVDLDERKFQYLLKEKQGKLKKAGLGEADREQVSQAIQTRLSSNYIYNLTYLEEHDVVKFNLMLEIPHQDGYPTRLTAVLEYLPGDRSLRVITLH